jgi:plasmid stabilization system protein ParE
MSGFLLHPDALTDLNEIWEYIAADNLDAADRVLEEIFEVMRLPNGSYLNATVPLLPGSVTLVSRFSKSYA